MKPNQTSKVFIDGFETAEAYIVNLEHEIREIGPFHGDESQHFVYKNANVRASIKFPFGIELEFQVQGYETDNEGNYHFYGPLRNMFPKMFENDIEPWQESYLSALGKPSLDRFKLKKDDPLFNTLLATTYKKGWNCKT